jgi:hypothetical protein
MRTGYERAYKVHVTNDARRNVIGRLELSRFDLPLDGFVVAASEHIVVEMFNSHL